MTELSGGAQFAGTVAVVTGAASGIGRATAKLLAQRGAQVLAVDLDLPGLQSLRAEPGMADQIDHVAVDLVSPDAPTVIFERCRQTFGTPTVLANIAGKAGDAPIGATSDEDLEFYFRINFTATFAMSRQAVREFSAGGAIVNTSSTFGLVGVPGSGPYSAAKAAVSGMTSQMAADYGPRGIRVNAVAPGLIETPATAHKIADGIFDDAVTRSRPIPRVGVPLDVARAVAFLASEEAAFITGVTLPVCGGWSTTRARYQS